MITNPSQRVIVRCKKDLGPPVAMFNPHLPRVDQVSCLQEHFLLHLKQRSDSGVLKF